MKDFYKEDAVVTLYQSLSVVVTCTLESLVAMALTLRGARTMLRSVLKLDCVDHGP